METAEQIKDVVRQKYGAIAELSEADGCGCGPTSCCGPQTTSAIPIDMAVGYDALNGYVAEADLGLGCGLPTQFAQIKPGDVVVDLGSGAGNDCFVARAETGETGRVIGLDMTPAMIDRARKNAKTLGYTNVEFVYGDIEDMPLPDNLADVVVSNCVMNLVPNKGQAFTETFRILKPGGHFSISDIVLQGELPENLRRDAELYVGCVSGAIQKEAYLQQVAEAGFVNITIQKEREIGLPDEVLQNYLTDAEIAEYRRPLDEATRRGIFSVTVFAQKPAERTVEATSPKAACCGPDCC
ncbi:arsenite methyltransferase [Rudanella paleaurantiibacter]|uniref:Arsenite methyltransferase n=1 Tax=Rudanella paleaurantiibacter TaxID=2614655 RepID=A0A7J5TT14_9BACT|nr:arsenite methyltransferase [Rudanella paleaurantiibacter]KAB7726840.1 arsenite methyltransferase [Rudanella paleaurantiibacter]